MPLCRDGAFIVCISYARFKALGKEREVLGRKELIKEKSIQRGLLVALALLHGIFQPRKY